MRLPSGHHLGLGPAPPSWRELCKILHKYAQMYFKHIDIKEIRVRLYPEGGLESLFGSGRWKDQANMQGKYARQFE